MDDGNRDIRRRRNEAMKERLLPHHSVLVEEHLRAIIWWRDAENQLTVRTGYLHKICRIELAGGTEMQGYLGGRNSDLRRN